MKERKGKTKGDPLNKKQSLYLPDDVLDELHREARRLDRPLSWVIQHAWRLARAEIMASPGDGTTPDPAPPKPRPPVTRPLPSPPPTPDPRPRPQPAPPAAAPSGLAPPQPPRIPVFDDYEGHDHTDDPYHLAGRRFGVF